MIIKQKDLVSVIIVNWNGREHLKVCLPSLYNQSYKKIEVIVVDNGSSDGSVAWLKRDYPKVRIIENKRNMGFAEGNNIGFRKAKGDFILFLNNDTKVTKSFLTELVRALKSNDGIGGVQSKILLMDSPKQLDSVGSYLTNTGFLYHVGVYEKDSSKYNKEINIYSAKGACMMFRRNVLEEILVDGEIFDKKYFLYFEETDMCHRVWLAGYRIIYVPRSVIYHKFGASSIKLLKPFVEYHSYKNRINSYIKNLGFAKLIEILLVHLLICEALSLFFILRGKFEIFKSIQKAIFWNILNIKSTLEKRYRVQLKIRKVKDDIIFPRIMKNPNVRFYMSQFTGWNIDQIGARKNA